jgi:N-acetylated-alpha-linked acidic dipeptidase
LRLADADLLPFEFSNFAETVGKYVDELSKLADDMRTKTDELNLELKEKTLEAVSDPTKTYVPPKEKDAVPYLNIAPMQNALAAIQQKSKEFGTAVKDLDPASLSRATIDSLDNILMHAERSLTSEKGLPRRPWFVHQVYAPGAYTGYGVKTLPAVREAIEQRNWKEADDQVEVVASVLRNFSEQLGRATAIVNEVRAAGK